MCEKETPRFLLGVRGTLNTLVLQDGSPITVICTACITSAPAVSKGKTYVTVSLKDAKEPLFKDVDECIRSHQPARLRQRLADISEAGRGRRGHFNTYYPYHNFALNVRIYQ